VMWASNVLQSRDVVVVGALAVAVVAFVLTFMRNKNHPRGAAVTREEQGKLSVCTSTVF
jgi:hypothetical protein